MRSKRDFLLAIAMGMATAVAIACIVLFIQEHKSKSIHYPTGFFETNPVVNITDGTNIYHEP